jgi:hypothetical protein
LRFLFSLALILVAGALIVVSSLYAYVVYTHGKGLERRYPELIQNSFVYEVDGNRIGEFRAENRLNTRRGRFERVPLAGGRGYWRQEVLRALGVASPGSRELRGRICGRWMSAWGDLPLPSSL